MASNNNSNTQNPFEDSSESGLSQSRNEQSTPSHHEQGRDLIDLQQNRAIQSQHQTFSTSTSTSTLNPQQPAYTHQQIKRNDSSFAIDEGKGNQTGV